MTEGRPGGRSRPICQEIPPSVTRPTISRPRLRAITGRQGDRGEFLGVLDQGAAAGGALHRLAVGAADRVAGHGHAVTSADEALAELRTLRAQGCALAMGLGSSVSVADLMGAFAP